MRKTINTRQKQRGWDEGAKPGPQTASPMNEDDEALLFEEGADLGRIMQAIRAHIPLIILIGLIGTGIAIAYSLTLTSIYTAEARVQLDPRTRDISDVEDVLTPLPANDMVLDTEVETLSSVRVLNRVVDDLNLMRNPEFNTTLRDDEGFLSGLLGSSADASDEPPTQAELEQMVLENVRDALSISRVGLTTMISIRCDSEVPEMAQRLCNTLAEHYVAQQLEGKIAETDRASEWLTGRIDELRGELQAREQEIEEFRVRNQIVSGDGETLSQQQLAQLNLQLAMANQDIAEKRARLRQARTMRQSGSGNQSLAEVLGSEAILQLREQQALIIRTRADLATRYRPTHPDFQRVELELRDIETQIDEEINRILTSLSNELDVAQERSRSLERSIQDLTARMGENALTVGKLRELEQEAQATREIYLSFLSRSKGIADQESIQTADSQISSRAVLPTEPSRPSRSLIVVIAGFVSGMVGVGLAVARDFADDRVRVPDDVRRAGMAHLGSVPLVSDRRYRGRPHRDLLDRGTSVFSEAFEELHTRIIQSSSGRPPRTVLFTSAAAAEGKTTSALCFALAAARSGKKVVLLEGDLRCPTIYDVVAIQGVQVEDLKAVLDGDLDWDDVAWMEPQTGLRILPVKSPSEDPLAHLSSAKLAELLEDLRAEFDMVVIDTAPVLPVSDALKLLPYADKVIFVMRWRETTKADAEMALRKIREVGGDFAGAILTFVDPRQRWRFGDCGLPNAGGRNRRYYGR